MVDHKEPVVLDGGDGVVDEREVLQVPQHAQLPDLFQAADLVRVQDQEPQVGEVLHGVLADLLHVVVVHDQCREPGQTRHVLEYLDVVVRKVD